jgi:Tfp pilus assembly protein PilX
MTLSRKLAFPSSSHQSGVVLFIALIFLVLLTVMALTTFTISKGGQQIIGNMASRNQTFQAALQTSEAAISTDRLINTPSQALFDPATGTYSATADIDVNGDGKTIINTAVAKPTCISGKESFAIPVVTASGPETCINGTSSGTAGGGAAGFACYDLILQFTTTAQDSVTNAAAAVTQGFASRTIPYKQALDLCVTPAGVRLL